MKPVQTIYQIERQRAWMGDCAFNLLCQGEGRPEKL